MILNMKIIKSKLNFIINKLNIWILVSTNYDLMLYQITLKTLKLNWNIEHA